MTGDRGDGVPLLRIVLAVAVGAGVAVAVSWYFSATLGIALGLVVAGLLAGRAVRGRR